MTHHEARLLRATNMLCSGVSTINEAVSSLTALHTGMVGLTILALKRGDSAQTRALDRECRRVHRLVMMTIRHDTRSDRRNSHAA